MIGSKMRADSERDLPPGWQNLPPANIQNLFLENVDRCLAINNQIHSRKVKPRFDESEERDWRMRAERALWFNLARLDKIRTFIIHRKTPEADREGQAMSMLRDLYRILMAYEFVEDEDRPLKDKLCATKRFLGE